MTRSQARESAALEAYLGYYTRLASERRALRGATVLHTPGSPLLGANAAFADGEEGFTRAALWLHARGAPALFASTRPLTGQPVQTLTLGRFAVPAAGAVPPDLRVEQVSSQHLALIAQVLTAAWDLPDWSDALNLSLRRALDGDRAATWLVAYRSDTLVGAALLLGTAVHLWGVTEPDALPTLLGTAATLAGGAVETSAPEGWNLALEKSGALHFSLGASPLEALN